MAKANAPCMNLKTKFMGFRVSSNSEVQLTWDQKNNSPVSDFTKGIDDETIEKIKAHNLNVMQAYKKEKFKFKLGIITSLSAPLYIYKEGHRWFNLNLVS